MNPYSYNNKNRDESSFQNITSESTVVVDKMMFYRRGTQRKYKISQMYQDIF